MLNRLIPSRLLSGLTALLIACGGGGGGAGNVSAPSTPSLSGVAAIGMAKMKAQCMDCNSLTTEEFLFEQALLVSQNSQGGLVILSKTLKYK